MNLDLKDGNYRLFDQEQPNRVETQREALRRATQLVNGEMDIVRGNGKTPLTVEEVWANAKDPVKQKQRRFQGLKRHATYPLTNDFRYQTVHPSKMDLRDLTFMDSGNKKYAQKRSKIYEEITKQERMIKTQGQDVKTKKYQLCESSLESLLRSAHRSWNGSSEGSSNSNPTRIASSVWKGIKNDNIEGMETI